MKYILLLIPFLFNKTDAINAVKQKYTDDTLTLNYNRGNSDTSDIVYKVCEQQKEYRRGVYLRDIDSLQKLK